MGLNWFGYNIFTTHGWWIWTQIATSLDYFRHRLNHRIFFRYKKQLLKNGEKFDAKPTVQLILVGAVTSFPITTSRQPPDLGADVFVKSEVNGVPQIRPAR